MIRMKSTFFLSILLCLITNVTFGQDTEELTPYQKRMRRITPPPLREVELGGKDQNHAFEWANDKDFNSFWNWCFTLDGEFVGPGGLGIDRYSVRVENAVNRPGGLRVPMTVRGIGPERDSLVVEMSPGDMSALNKSYKIRGHRISGFTNFTSDKKIKLITLDDVRKIYCPDVEGNVLFMINKFFITQNIDLYKLDKDFIYKVEKLSSEDLCPIKDNIKEDFTIIRIFTRTHHNWHQSTVGGYNH